MSDHVTPFTSEQVGSKAVRFSSKGVFATHKDHMVDPYAATRIPKEHQVQGFYYWPQDTPQRPSIVLLHDKWGLMQDFRDLAVRLACEGYVVMVPNLYGRQGGMVTTSEEVADALAER
ncbi:MAG: dienelactone hydrolase family protein, partial [Nitrospira sp.]|nr:dienelactone hydrolase family protein [Nitrospira sp.]